MPTCVRTTKEPLFDRALIPEKTRDVLLLATVEYVQDIHRYEVAVSPWYDTVTLPVDAFGTVGYAKTASWRRAVVPGFLNAVGTETLARSLGIRLLALTCDGVSSHAQKLLYMRFFGPNLIQVTKSSRWGASYAKCSAGSKSESSVREDTDLGLSTPWARHITT